MEKYNTRNKKSHTLILLNWKLLILENSRGREFMLVLTEN